MPLGWYVARLRRMSPAEVVQRGRDEARKAAWRRRQVRPGRPRPAAPPVDRSRACPVRLDRAIAASVPASARARLLDAAERLLGGEWKTFGVVRHDLVAPDWFRDPASGRRSSPDRYAFSINHRSEQEVGNVKHVWELSRHHHVTVLAAAWFLTGDTRYAEMAAHHLRSWWDENPFLSGVHWTSGIELGIRLLAWTWSRRLLDGWPGAGELFEQNESAARQLHWHQTYLAAFRSGGSSANNHVIAEAAGQLVAACGLPWFAESERWRGAAAALLERELERNTFPSGLNRELASEYHGFVAELGVLAAVEAEAAGHPLSEDTWARLTRMFDAAASVVDVRLRPPRQGDGDDGRTLVLDAPEPGGEEGWSSVLALGAAALGGGPWWPATAADVRSTVVGAVLGGRGRCARDRPLARLSHFPDAGFTLLRTPAGERPEMWCRCDGGPHGFLSIAAHAHADALSIEVRHDGVDVLADPGTYCYHGEPGWRAYFRSTAGHNTLELAGRDQSRPAGPFLWDRHAQAHVFRSVADEPGGAQQWSAEHDGYTDLDPPAIHRRDVTLDVVASRLTVVDRVIGDGSHRCRLAFHFGPAIDVRLAGPESQLRWSSSDGPVEARLTLPSVLQWTLVRGAISPIGGWYSPRFGRKEPSSTVVGEGTCGAGDELITVVDFAPGH